MQRRARLAMVWSAIIVPVIFATVLQAKADPVGPDVEEGDRLAHNLCINCHVVDNQGPVIRTDQVPSFPWIAQQPGVTAEFLRNWLGTSHPRMPDFTLSREAIRQISVYILSLRKS